MLQDRYVLIICCKSQLIVLVGDWQGHANAKIEFIDRLDHLVVAKQTECLCHDCLHLLVHALDAESDYLENQISSYSRSNKILQNEELLDTDFSTADDSNEVLY